MESSLSEHQAVIGAVAQLLSKSIYEAAQGMAATLSNGGTIFWCGNGGSASDSQHLSAELVGRFKTARKALRSVALSADTSIITCVANDFGFKKVFSRQIEALARKGDLLIVMSTTGKSENVLQALSTANEMQVKTIALLGRDGGQAGVLAKQALIVPSESTARIQEAHMLIGHILCDIIEQELDLG